MEWYVASGALGWDGRGWFWEKPLVWSGIIDPALFTVTTKTLTLNPNKGNWFAVCPVRGGVWNNMGLPNKGLRWWLDNYYLKNKAVYKSPCHNIHRGTLPYKTLLSLAPSTPEEAVAMMNLLDDYDVIWDWNFKGLELNVSCPNVHNIEFEQISEIIDACNETVASNTKGNGVVRLRMTIKLNRSQIRFGYRKLQELVPKCKAVSLNSVPDTYGNGAWSGKRAQLGNWSAAALLQHMGFKVIWPSIWEYGDIQRAIDGGAQAISFGAVHLLRSWAPSMWVRRYMKERV